MADDCTQPSIVTMSYSSRRANDTSRKVIDTAIGVLVGLRGCSPDQAFAELVRVVHDSGVGIGTLAAGLVALAGGGSSAGHAEAFSAWGELVRRRPLEPVANAS
ncbi:hypothetical protein MMOR_27150 [Mycolicibacterium moriokaense]|uniref:ANTAR domain-containing protein n=2 Tax=Mycolicibacterium moriokaense TaxID=39691 RepID=A0AAD1HBW5_9MYCO|nr:hypothetical protein MMOR_27150 [Mycolicibacterium moriokaense]